MPNTLDASQVMTRVLNFYERYLPAGLAPTVRSLNPARVFRILPEAQYKPYFGAVFRNFFAATNVVALGGTKKMTSIGRGAAEPFDSLRCPAFCAPAVQVTDRVIYVNRDIGVTIGTLYHEFIHFLSHGNFYPEFYGLGGRNPAVLEGVTEYLTRALGLDVTQDRQSQRKYQDWFEDVVRVMGWSRGGLEQLTALAFRGDFSLVARLGGVAPRL